MKNSKKLLLVAVVLLVAVLATILISCNTNVENYEFDLQGQDKLAKDAPILTVATNAEFAPFEFMEGGKIVGADIAIINAIGTKLGMKVKIEHMAFDAVLVALEQNKYDAAIAGLTVDEDRKMSFTASYFNSTQVLVVKKDSTKFDNANSADEVVSLLENTKIHVAKGQVGQYFADGGAFEYPGIKGADVKIYNNVGSAINGVKNDEAVITDIAVAKKLVEKNKNFKVIDIELTEEKYAIGVNQSKTELYNKINAALEELLQDGTIDKIREHYNIA